MAIFIPFVALGIKCIAVSHLHLSLMISCLLGQCLYLLGYWVCFVKKMLRTSFQNYLRLNDLLLRVLRPIFFSWSFPPSFPSISLFFLPFPGPFIIQGRLGRARSYLLVLIFSPGTQRGLRAPWQDDCWWHQPREQFLPRDHLDLRLGCNHWWNQNIT